MSDSWLVFFPLEPTTQVDSGKLDEARAYLQRQHSENEQVAVKSFPHVSFIDPGSNLEAIRCPFCQANLEDWWQDAMETAHQNKFANLSVDTPCCGKQTSLADLEYELPAGFARVELAIRDPNQTKTEELGKALSQILGMPLKSLWRHI